MKGLPVTNFVFISHIFHIYLLCDISYLISLMWYLVYIIVGFWQIFMEGLPATNLVSHISHIYLKCYISYLISHISCSRLLGANSLECEKYSWKDWLCPISQIVIMETAGWVGFLSISKTCQPRWKKKLSRCRPIWEQILVLNFLKVWPHLWCGGQEGQGGQGVIDQIMAKAILAIWPPWVSDRKI